MGHLMIQVTVTNCRYLKKGFQDFLQSQERFLETETSFSVVLVSLENLKLRSFLSPSSLGCKNVFTKGLYQLEISPQKSEK